MDHNKEIPEIAKVVERNVDALLNRRKQEIEKRSSGERTVDAIIAFAGSISSVFIHLIFFGSWIAWNTGWLNLKPFDPQLVFLAIFVGVEAIFLTTFVLNVQKRMNVQADKWAELDLQVSLLTEHEVTRVLNLVKEIAKKMDIREAHDKEIEELSKDIHPDKVLDTMEKASQ